MAREELTIWNIIWRRLLVIIRAAGTRAALNALFGFVTFSAVLIVDLIAKSLPKIQGATLDISRTVLLGLGIYFWSRAITPFIIRYRDLARSVGKAETSVVPVKILRWFAISLAIGCLFSFLPSLFTLTTIGPNFEPKNPNTVTSIDVMGAIWLVGFSVLLVGFVRFLFIWQRTIELRRRLLLWFIPIVLFSMMEYFLKTGIVADEAISVIILNGLRALVIFSTLFLWFRIEWMPHVSRTDKNTILLYSASAAILSLLAFILYLGLAPLFRYSIILASGMTVTLLAFTSYFGLVFFNALFTLSSTELVERRAAEVKSLAKLTRFSSDVLTSELLLDIPKLADQITTLAREATKSDCAWLELQMKPLFGQTPVNGTVYHSYNAIQAEIADKITNEISPYVKTLDRMDRTIAEEIAKTQRPVLLTSGAFIKNDWQTDGAVIPKQLSSLIAVPLLHKEELRGALYIAKEQEYGFDDEDVTVLTAFSDVASLALDTARLLSDSIEKQKFDGELRAARAMQKTLLPEAVPYISGFEVSAISIPAYEVGGDYYDFSNLWDGSPIVLIGDVSGKGISASIFMAETKGIVQALAPMMMSVRELFIGTNDALMRNVTEQGFRRSFVTLTALSFKGNVIKYARAGHMPLLKVSPDGSHEYIQPKGMGIGFAGKKIFDTVLEEKDISIERGTTIVLFSDGITEVRNAEGEELGYDRFAKIAHEASAEHDTEKIIEHILHDVLDYAESSSFSDDATFVVIRRI